MKKFALFAVLALSGCSVSCGASVAIGGGVESADAGAPAHDCACGPPQCGGAGQMCCIDFDAGNHCNLGLTCGGGSPGTCN